MKRKIQRILAIDPGTRYLGYALLDGGELVHYGVRAIQQLKSAREKLKEGRKIIARLIDDFRPNILIVEKTYFANNRKSVLLNTITYQIRILGKRKGLRVVSMAANTVRKTVCGNGFASKNDVARFLVSRYPDLIPYLTSDRRWKEKFYRNMFDAAALCIAARLQSESGKNSIYP